LALKVVAGFLKKGDRFLLVRRPINKKRGGLWEFPGGKVENGETLEEAIKRELKEELGIKTKVRRFLSKINYKYPEGEIELILLEIDSKEEPILKEALELRWVNFEEIKEIELCPADKKLLESLKKTCKK
jgi:mutator protein MutT